MKSSKFSSELVSLLDPMMGEADDPSQTAKYRELDTNNEEDVKALIRERLMPSFTELPQSKKLRLVDELEQCLADPDSDFERLFYSALLPFSGPANIRLFFAWLLAEMSKISS
jgi:hypothetical protein